MNPYISFHQEQSQEDEIRSLSDPVARKIAASLRHNSSLSFGLQLAEYLADLITGFDPDLTEITTANRLWLS